MLLYGKPQIKVYAKLLFNLLLIERIDLILIAFSAFSIILISCFWSGIYFRSESVRSVSRSSSKSSTGSGNFETSSISGNSSSSSCSSFNSVRENIDSQQKGFPVAKSLSLSNLIHRFVHTILIHRFLSRHDLYTVCFASFWNRTQRLSMFHY